MILQLLFDDPFADYAIKQFAPYRKLVRIVMVRWKASVGVKHVKLIDDVEVIEHSTPAYEELCTQLGTYSAVIVNSLCSPWQWEIVRLLPAHVKLAWVVYGAEVYDRHDMEWHNLSESSRFLLSLRHIKGALSRESRPSETPLDVLRRVDYCLNSSPELFEEIKRYIGNERMKHIRYSYFAIEDMVGGLLDKRANGANVFLGNCANITNNHITALNIIRRTNFPRNGSLIVPLSYGAAWTRKFVCLYAKLCFRAQFRPLLSYLPREEYNQILLSCGTFIDCHYRPNAFANILTSLWIGARVYVSKHNVQTAFLKNLGLRFCILEEDLIRNGVEAYAQMSDEDLRHNREILMANYSKLQIGKNVDNIIRILGQERN